MAFSRWPTVSFQALSSPFSTHSIIYNGSFIPFPPVTKYVKIKQNKTLGTWDCKQYLISFCPHSPAQKEGEVGLGGTKLAALLAGFMSLSFILITLIIFKQWGI